MVKTSEATFGGGPERKVGGIIVPESLQEQKEALAIEVANRAKKIEKLDTFVASDPSKPVNELDSFRQQSRKAEAQVEIRKSTVSILSKTPNVAVTLGNNSDAYKSVVGSQLGDWKAVANNKDAVAIVKYDMAVQSAALTPSPDARIIIPGGYKPRGQAEMKLDTRTEGDLRLNKDGEIRDDFVFRSEGSAPKKPENSVDFTESKKEDFSALGQEYAQSIANANHGNEVRVNNFKPGEQEAAKAEYFRLHPEERPKTTPLDIDLAKMEKDSTLKGVDINLAEMERDVLTRNGVDINLNKFTTEALVAEALRRSPGILKPLPSPVASPQQRQVLERQFTESSTESLNNVEQIRTRLEERRQGAAGRLMEKGLTTVSKGLELFANVSPRKKAVIGLILAGASVASGGMTSVLSKGFSTASFASSHYNEKLKANEAAGIETNKKKLAVQSVFRGFILAMATSQLISILTENVDMSAVIDSGVEKVSGIKDSIKEWFSSLTASAPDTGTAMTPSMDNSVFPNAQVMLDPITVPDADSLAPGEVLNPESLAPLPGDYEIKSGENLTKIMRTEILSKIPGIESLSPGQQNNLIENYLKEAAKYKDISFFDSVNQFANPNLIQPGDHLDLEKMRQGMMSFKFPEFGGATLFEHAKTVAGSAGGSSVASAAFSSAVESAPAGATFTGADIFDNLADNPDTLENQGSLRPGAALEPSQILEDGEDAVDEGTMDTRGTVPYDDSTDSPRIRGLGYRNNA